MKITLLGVGNILLKDEGIGVRVVQTLDERYSFPDNVELFDGGTLGLGLLSVITSAEHLIVIDAVKNGQPPGTLYRFTRDDLPYRVLRKASLHQVDLIEALTMATLLSDEKPKEIVVIGVEPKDISPWGLELSSEVAEKKEVLVSLVLEELSSLGVQYEER